MYSTDQTGPNSHAGGDQKGFTNCVYQVAVGIFLRLKWAIVLTNGGESAENFLYFSVHSLGKTFLVVSLKL